MDIIKDLESFKTWQGESLGREEYVAPSEFPCLVYEIVRSFGMEEEQPIYLYKTDLQNMLKALDSVKPAAQDFCHCGDNAFINDETSGVCGNCGKPFARGNS